MNKSDKNNNDAWLILLQLSRDVFYQIGKHRVSGSLIEQIKIAPEYYQQVALLELDKCDILNEAH